MDNLFSSIDNNSNNLPIKKAILFCDGGSRGNPGIAGSGAVLYDKNKSIIAKKTYFCGHQTNNYAEYMSLVIGLKEAIELKITDISIFMDSKLAIEQMNGNWKVKNANIRPLFEKAKALSENFSSIKLSHIPREKNSAADELANQAMDQQRNS